MEIANVAVFPAILIAVYLLMEIYKVIFTGDKAKALIPAIAAFIGITFGILLWVLAPEIIGASSIIESAMIGLVSGASATGTHQIVKQLDGLLGKTDK